METLISTENGSPHIIYKNKILYTLEPGTNSWLSEKIAAVQHTNGKDWWVFFINHKTGNFIKLLVTENGATISEQPIPELKIDPITPNTLIGEMSFSKQGDRLAGVFMDKGIYVFDFDRCTGEIKVNKKFPIYYTQVNTFPAGLAYGLVFSSNGVYLYSSTLDSVLQLNLRTNARSFLFRQTSIPKMQLGQLELANNGKIYMANYCQYAFDSSYCHHLGVVTYPDKPYPYCQFQRLGLNLGDNVSNWGLPNMPVYAPGLPYAYAGGSQAICGGDSVQIGAPRQTCQYYSWQPIIGLSDSTSADPKAFPYVTTIYTLTTWIDGSDALSIDSVTVYVNPFANDLISIQAEPTVFTAQPYTVHFSAQGIDTTAFLCTWDFGDGQTAMGANVAHTYDSIAGYAVKLYVLTADGACADTLSYNLKLTIITGIDDKREAQVQAFQVYPNPAQNHFTVSTTLPYGTAQMTVFDAKGVQIGSYPIQNGNQTIPTNNWQNGIYLCKCVSPDGKIYTTKILILQ